MAQEPRDHTLLYSDPMVAMTEAEHLATLLEDPVSGNASSSITVGDLTLLGISDGYFTLPVDMIGSPDHPTAVHDALRIGDRPVRLPVGCFLIRGEQNILIDTGQGPTDYEEGQIIYGGRLLPHLAQLGLRPDDIDVIALTHLHDDHSGTIGDRVSGEPVFRNAKVYVGAPDWAFFVEQQAPMLPASEHISAALREMDRRGQVELLDTDADITPVLRAIAAPGHTPGHFVYSVHSGAERVVVLGDAFVCPQHLSELDWAIVFDCDAALARRTRERLQQDLELHGGGAVGCHFPELTMLNRVLTTSRAEQR